MYVWRGKQRRDRREFLLGGVKLWGAPKGTQDRTKDDEHMRQVIEDRHIHTYEQRVRVAIFRFLNTKQGKQEISQVVEEMDKINVAALRKAREEAGEALVDEDGNEIEIEAVPEEMKKKANIHEIFRKFDEDGSDSIDRLELRILLDELRVPMTDDELAELVDRLDSDGGGEIEFDEFYDWFVAEAEGAKARNKMANVSNALKGFIGRIFKNSGDGDEDGNKSDSIYKGFKQMVLEVEARNLILDSTVHQAVESIRKEFRIAHPPLFLCEHDNCGLAFLTKRQLNEHMLDLAFHRTKEYERLELVKKFQPVENALDGIMGRQLKANRMLFNNELGTFEGRILAAVPAPFRPRLNDPGGIREAQQREGILVRGSDPKAGVRALPRTKGLRKQYRAPGTKKPGTDQLQDVVIELLHCRDHKIDVHIAPATSTHAEVMFCWGGYARESIFIKGEFNGWQPEELYPHERAATGQNVIFKMLTPGKYRYRYIIDGEDAVDPEASIEDPERRADTESLPNNILLVINPTPTSDSERSGSAYKLFGGGNLNHINLRNACVFDDGAWALASYMSKNSFIKTLDLSYNSISDEGMQAIAGGLVNFVGLETLKLNGNGFGFDGCSYLFRTLNDHKFIKVLEMSDNRIADDGAEVLGELMVHHLSLTELYLDSCYIGNYGLQKLGDSLESNKTLEKLSLSKNRFDKDGVAPFMKSVNLNGKLRSLILSYNNLGAEGVRNCGDTLLTNDSLRVLDLSYTNALSNKSGMGMHALGTALRTKNKGLQELYLLGNQLNEEVLPEFAYALHFNRGLRVCDLRANNLDEKWFKPNHTISTKLMEDLPSVTTCMDRNIKTHEDPKLAEKYSVKPRPMEDTNEGLWTVRRRWRQLNKKGEKQRLEAEAMAEEQGRINLEEEYIKEKLEEEMVLLEKFLKAPEGITFCKHLSKRVTEYIHAIVAGAEAALTAKLQKATAANDAALLAAKQLEEKGKAEAEKPALSNIVARKEEARRLEQQKKDEAEALKKIQETLEQTEAAAKMHDELSRNWVTNFHLGIISTLFVISGGDENYFLEPQKIDRIFNALCLPLREEDAMTALKNTVILGGKNMIGLKRFVKHIKQNSYDLAQKNRLKRFRLLADLIIAPPLDEAKTMLREFYKAEEIKRLTVQYRMLPRMKPKFLCMFCNKRFVNEKSLARHKRKLSNHQRYLQKEEIMDSLQFILRRAKYFMTGTYFPAYYELAPVEHLPEGHLTQIFDSRGADGRPIGVLESERTIRAEDSLGYWVKVRWGDGFGWMIFRTGTIPPKDILVPAMRHISKGFWSNADIWDHPKYYRLAEDLPDNAEIKVRFMPALKGHGSEIVGYLKKGWIIECGGINGDFIQVKYNNYECVWALHTLNGRVLMERLNDALQNRLQYIVTKSPCVLSDEQLSVDEDELTAISSLKEEDGVAADVNIEDLKVMDAQDEEAQAGLEEISVAHSK